MKYKLGGQRPLDLRDVRAKKRPSIVGVLFVAPALLLIVGLIAQVGVRFYQEYQEYRQELRLDPATASFDSGLFVAIGIGLASLVVVWGVAAMLPSTNPDR